MVAVLAASCSSDNRFVEIADIQKNDNQDIAQKIEKVITKSSNEIVEDAFLWQPTVMYAQFTRELLKRDFISLLPAFAGVNQFNDGKLTVDFGNVKGRFYSYYSDHWTYKPAWNGLQFNFHGPMGEVCKLDIDMDTSNVNYISPCQNLELKVPSLFEDKLYVYDDLVGTGTVKFVSDDNRMEIDRHWGDYWMLFAFMNSDLNLFGHSQQIFLESFSVQRVRPVTRNIITFGVLSAESSTRTNFNYYFNIGDENSDGSILFEINSSMINEFIGILKDGLNYSLDPCQEFPYDEFSNRISTFNENDPVTFRFKDLFTNVEGQVELCIYEPDSIVKDKHVGLIFKYNIDGQDYIMETPVERSIMDILSLILGPDFDTRIVSVVI